MCHQHAHFEALKLEADQHWLIDPRHSLELGKQIIREAQKNECQEYVALGTMVCADALKLLGELKTAWALFDEAGQLYLAAHNEFGWARTRIGRLAICFEVGQVDAAFGDMAHAVEIFTQANDLDRNRRLYQNAAIAYQNTGQLGNAKLSLLSAIEYTKKSQAINDRVMGELLLNLSSVNIELGNWSEAKRQLEQALNLFTEHGIKGGIAATLNNLADISLKFGYYRDVIGKLYQALNLLRDEIPQLRLGTQRTLIECFLTLGRYQRAMLLGRDVVTSFVDSEASNQVARTMRHLAMAYAGLAHQTALTQPDKASSLFRLAHQTLDEPEKFFKNNNMLTMLASVNLQRGQIMLLARDYESAYKFGTLADGLFQVAQASGLRIPALLLCAESLAHLGQDLTWASQLAYTARGLARAEGMILMRQRVQYVLGMISETRQTIYHAKKHYELSAKLVENIQRDLSFTLVPGTLQTQDMALRALARLYFEENNPSQAYASIERIKGLASLRFLRNPESQRWNTTDPVVQALVDKFNDLRAQYFEQTSTLESPWRETPPTRQNSLPVDILRVQQELQSTQDQLFLNTRSTPTQQAYQSTLPEIQRHLSAREMVLEYFVNDKHMWVLVIEPSDFQIYSLGPILPNVAKDLEMFHDILDHITGLSEQHPLIAALQNSSRTIFHSLYQMLVAPFQQRLRQCRRLYIVPFGLLHNIPFNLLLDGQRYLIQRCQCVILPHAALLLRQKVVAPAGALALHYATGNDLQAAYKEVSFVADRFKGKCISGEDAVFDQLKTSPSQILHLGMHARHIFDQPEFSYIAFADKRVMADDILQLDLSYELVVMSACQTGIVRPSGGDEPIGLGRAFLYAGAGAIVSSLWAVNDESTFRFMRHFFTLLRRGYTKAGALQKAQVDSLQRPSTQAVHPAFWGAFQLIGDPRPLSVHL